MTGRKAFSLFFIALFILMTSCNDVSITRQVIDTIYLPPGTPEVHVQIWEQPIFVDGTDIIWAIDRSCSMHNDAEKVVAGIEAMMDALPNDEDWRMTIISTDIEEALQNDTYPLNNFSTIDDVWDSYDATSDPNPPPGESGFDAFVAYVDQGSYAHTWMREDAFTQLVVVSDENDESLQTPGEFVNWINNFNAYSFSAIVGLQGSGCPGVAVFGFDYIEVAEETGGLAIDFCDDWALAVQNLAVQTVLTEEFLLDYIPDIETVVVTVNNEDNTDWSYDELLNAIIFDVPTDYEDLILIAYALPYEVPVE